MANVEMPFQCYYCKERFLNEAHLRFHKVLAMEAENPTHAHYWCQKHDKDYHSHKALFLHMKQYHPKEQKLECPGCGVNFTRLGGVFTHIEQDHCSELTMNDIIEARVEMLQFTQKFEDLKTLAAIMSKKLNLNFAHCMVEPTHEVKANYAEYQVAQPLPPTDTMKAPRPPDGKQDPQSVICPEPDFETGSSDTTNLPVGAEANNLHAREGSGWDSDCPAGHGDFYRTTHDVGDLVLPWKDDESGWYGNGTGFPDNDPRSKDPQSAVGPWSPAQSEAWSLHLAPGVSLDPYDPTFDVANFWIPDLEQYSCPYNASICWRNYETSEGLINHLKSKACMQSRYLCPACGHRFNSTSALLQHVETTNRCPVRQLDSFRTLLDQLTGGIADIDGRHEDNNIKYSVQPVARMIMGPEPVGREETEEEHLKRVLEVTAWATNISNQRALSRAASTTPDPPREIKLKWTSQRCQDSE